MSDATIQLKMDQESFARAEFLLREYCSDNDYADVDPQFLRELLSGFMKSSQRGNILSCWIDIEYLELWLFNPAYLNL